MPGERRYGMDHNHYKWNPIISRPSFKWPGGARIAVCVLVNLEHSEWDPPKDSFVTDMAGGLGWKPFPNYPLLSHREYGHRVGIFRVLSILEKYGVDATVPMDALTAKHYPYLVQYIQDHKCEIIGHGISASQMITSNMLEKDERKYIQYSIHTLKEATGLYPNGWLGPEFGESSRTPQILAEEGIRYVCDWVNDDQPYRMESSSGELFALPVSWELDDIHVLWRRSVKIDRYCRMIKENFDTLYQEGASSGRLLVLNLHPWLIGQPFRIGYLDDALAHIASHNDVWIARGTEIINWFQNAQID